MPSKPVNAARMKEFRAILRSFERLLSTQTRLCCAGVTLAQCHVLLEMNGSDPVTTGQLAERLKLDQSTLSRTVDGLVKRGLVYRSPNESDRRVTWLNLTESGRALREAINRANDEYYSRVFARIPEQRRNRVIDDFAQLTQAFLDLERRQAGEKECCE